MLLCYPRPILDQSRLKLRISSVDWLLLVRPSMASAHTESRIHKTASQIAGCTSVTAVVEGRLFYFKPLLIIDNKHAQFSTLNGSHYFIRIVLISRYTQK